MAKPKYSPVVEQFLQNRGEQRLRELGRGGMHADFARREGERWLHGKLLGAAIAGLFVGGTLIMAQALETSWEQSQTSLAYIREQHVQEMNDCLRIFIRSPVVATPLALPGNDPLTLCNTQIAAVDAYIYQVVSHPPGAG